MNTLNKYRVYDLQRNNHRLRQVCAITLGREENDWCRLWHL